MRFFRHNLLLILLLAIAAVIFTFYGCPYFHDQHHTGVCVIVYAVLALALIYGRAVTFRRGPRPRRPRPD